MSTLPPGMYVEVTVPMIDEGRFEARVNDAIQKGFRELQDWERAMDRFDGTFTVTAKITVARAKGAKEHVTIKSQVHLATPHIQQVSFAKAANGRVLCQADGAGRGDPDQMKLFDGSGQPTVTIDRSTGEVIEQKPVAGKINTNV